MNTKIESILDGIFKEKGYDVNCKVIKSKEGGVDFQCDNLFKLAKKYHKAPFVIGDEIVEEVRKLDDFSHYFRSIECVKPGFINIIVSDVFINECLSELMNKDKFGANLSKDTIVLDYGGPNVAKPLHVGHLRTAIIGQAINNILTFIGDKTISDVHLGDIGTQMGQVIYGIINDFPDTDFEDIDITLDYLNETYPRVSALCKENDSIHEKCLSITKELQRQLQEGSGDYLVLWHKIYDVSVTDIKRLYDYLNVKFDYWYGESDAFKYYDDMFKYLDDKGIVKEDNGALIIDVREADDKIEMPPCLIRKSDGAYLYATSDLGTIWQRKKDFDPNDMIYVVDLRQSLHFEQVFRACHKAGFYDGDFDYCGYGTVNGPDNKPFKTRGGGTLKLEDLISEVKDEFVNLRDDNKNMSLEDLDKIVNAIIKFADLQNDYTKNYIFDIKKFSEVNGKTGPYILYTYLRISKLLSGNDDRLSMDIYNEIDRDLRLKLLCVSDVINQSAIERKPHYIANYLYELSVLSNNFYESNKMAGIDEKIRNDYDIILSFNSKVIKTLLSLLGIHIPSKM